MKPLMLQGTAAFSRFRLTALQARVRELLPSCPDTMEARYVYFLNVTSMPAPEVMNKIHALLSATGPFTCTEGFIVAPRQGAISPWSSKATDIFRNCGLDNVCRVERGIHYRLASSDGSEIPLSSLVPALPALHDRMTESVYEDITGLFVRVPPAPMKTVDVATHGRAALVQANVELGLALSDEEMDYLLDMYQRLTRNPTDVELVMFGQVNSEHCRHKIFNADWIVDGVPGEHTLFQMIKHTHACRPEGTLVAYHDNSAVMEGIEDVWFEARRDAADQAYRYAPTWVDILMKVETHNHPTAISPYPGAATGVGGEIRDEAATGVGGKSKAGLAAFIVSDLQVPDFVMPWEHPDRCFPTRLATPFQIMMEGPIGGAGFGNEFGRPQLAGVFRTLETTCQGIDRGYHKPIMVAGGLGAIKRDHVLKQKIPAKALILQIGGPAMRIGLGGGAASSMATGSNAEDLDFNSVQRGNAEMERRCQEVIEGCIALGKQNPILSIHDIGAGGLSNGCPELVADTGAVFQLRAVPNVDESMSPMEIWCCEAQERYVLAVRPESLETFTALAARERCPVAVIGETQGDGRLVLCDPLFDTKPIDMDMAGLLGKPPKMVRQVQRRGAQPPALDLSGVNLEDALQRVLRLPAVADKRFLISIADRSITGLVARDQMTGPWQTPVADAAVTITSHQSVSGEAMTMGERTPLALVDAPASGRMAIGEAVTNMAGVHVGSIRALRLSANWMCACGEDGEDARLYDTVKAVGMDLCPALGLSIPVGKDSLSMRTVWQDDQGRDCKVVSPLSLIISAFAPVKDVRLTVTPDLKPGDSDLWLVDLGSGRNRLGGSALAQVYNQIGPQGPDLDDPDLLVRFFAAMQVLLESKLLLACHDRSDGGLIVTLLEMAFAGRRGVSVNLDGIGGADPLAALFAEELGMVVQVACTDRAKVEAVFAEHGLSTVVHRLGEPTDDGQVVIGEVYTERVSTLHRAWSELSFRMQSHRDNPECAREEFDGVQDEEDPGMNFHVSFDPTPLPLHRGSRPRVAVLREQGINGHNEMAAAFDAAGFLSIDVHMTDLLSGRLDLSTFSGLVACGGFSYGDVLGAGSGWARTILYHENVKTVFADFFARPDTFALGVCNGCQMLAQLKDIIPGAEAWPVFLRNRSEQFEARYVTVEVMASPSVLLKGMAGSRLGVPVAHGEGRIDFSPSGSAADVQQQHLATLRYVDHQGHAVERYPLNPNGSAGGLTGLTTRDGRVTIMMPHPERVFRTVQMSWRPDTVPFQGDASPWLRMFQNARAFTA